MAQILVRGLDDDLKQRLRARAKSKGRSLEAEVRAILVSAVSPSEDGGLGTSLAERFSEVGLEGGEQLERPDWASWTTDHPGRVP